MKKTLILPDTIEACHELIISQARLVEQLQRRAFGGSLKDRAVKYEGPSLFEELDEEAKLTAAKELEKVSGEVDAADRRRAEAWPVRVQMEAPWEIQHLRAARIDKDGISRRSRP